MLLFSTPLIPRQRGRSHRTIPFQTGIVCLLHQQGRLCLSASEGRRAGLPRWRGIKGVDYGQFSSSALIPGSVMPSKYSSMAPPPVLM